MSRNYWLKSQDIEDYNFFAAAALAEHALSVNNRGYDAAKIEVKFTTFQR